MEGQFYTLTNERQIEGFTEFLRKQIAEHGSISLKPFAGNKSRTAQQQKAIEVYCRQVADALNDAGYDKVAFYKAVQSKIKLPWTQESVKSEIWKVVQKAMLKKSSTTQLTKHEVSDIYETINARVLAERGLYVAFPEVTDGEQQA